MLLVMLLQPYWKHACFPTMYVKAFTNSERLVPRGSRWTTRDVSAGSAVELTLGRLTGLRIAAVQDIRLAAAVVAGRIAAVVV